MSRPSPSRATDRSCPDARIEHELLVLCSRTDPDPQEVRALLEQGGLDWNYLVTIAGYHGVQALLYAALRRLDPALLSDEHMDWMQRNVGARSAHSLILTHALGQLAELFEREQLRVLPVKGAVLALTVYGGVGLRPFVDLDLVVRPEDFGRLEALLRSKGFGSREMGRLQKASYLFIHRQYTFWGRLADLGLAAVHLDVHTAVMPPGYSYAGRFESLWDRARPLQIGTREVRALAPEDLLLVLCYHGIKNRWDRLKYVCDVAELLRAWPELDWAALLERADAMHSRRVCGLGLYLASEVLAAPLPEGAPRELVAEPWVQRLGADLARRLPQQPHMRVEPYLDRVRLNIFGQDSVLGGLRYGAYTLARRASELILPAEG